jgi:drug/metabolite transporter (DMT)-like permease
MTGILMNQLYFIIGISHTTPGHSAVMMAMIHIFVALLSMTLHGERISIAGWFGVLMGGAGAVGVVLSTGRTEQSATMFGDVITLCATLGFSLYTVLGRNLVREYGARMITTGAYVGTLPIAPFVLLYGISRQDWSLITWKGLAALAYILVFTTVVCYILYYWALARLRAVQVAIFVDIQPFLGTSISLLLGMETVGGMFILSGLAAMSGVLLVQLMPARE